MKVSMYESMWQQGLLTFVAMTLPKNK